jgi:hypothetical protein
MRPTLFQSQEMISLINFADLIFELVAFYSHEQLNSMDFDHLLGFSNLFAQRDLCALGWNVDLSCSLSRGNSYSKRRWFSRSVLLATKLKSSKCSCCVHCGNRKRYGYFYPIVRGKHTRF